MTIMHNAGSSVKMGRKRKHAGKKHRQQPPRGGSHVKFVASKNPPRNELIEKIRKREAANKERTAVPDTRSQGAASSQFPGAELGSRAGHTLSGGGYRHTTRLDFIDKLK